MSRQAANGLMRPQHSPWVVLWATRRGICRQNTHHTPCKHHVWAHTLWPVRILLTMAGRRQTVDCVFCSFICGVLRSVCHAALTIAAAAAAGQSHGQLRPASPPKLTAGCRDMPAIQHVRPRQLTAAPPTPSTRDLHHQHQQGAGHTASSARQHGVPVCRELCVLGCGCAAAA